MTWSEPLARRSPRPSSRASWRCPQAQRDYASAALTDLGGILICADEAEACAFANAYAVEHLQIATRIAEATLARIEHAAEILIGQNTPMAAANFTDRRAQHAALGRLRGRLERRDRAHVPGHELAGRARLRRGSPRSGPRLA